MNNYIKTAISAAAGCCLLSTSQAALTWNNITFTSTGGVTPVDDINASPWNGAGTITDDFLTGATGLIEGNFLATNSLPLNGNTTLSSTSRIFISFNIIGGTADIQSSVDAGSGEWFRFIVNNLSAGVTQIDYNITYQESVTATGAGITLTGVRADTDVDTVLTYAVKDQDQNNVDLTTATQWRQDSTN